MNVIIVDDHAGFRAQATALLRAEGLDVVGEAAGAAEALAAVDRLRPELVLLDVCLPSAVDGLACARRLANLDHPPRVILMSSRAAADFGPALHAAPALGFVTKDELCAARIDELLGDALAPPGGR